MPSISATEKLRVIGRRWAARARRRDHRLLGDHRDRRSRTARLVDRGTEADDAIATAAATLQHRLDGAVVTPAARTSLERALTEQARMSDQQSKQ